MAVADCRPCPPLLYPARRWFTYRRTHRSARGAPDELPFHQGSERALPRPGGDNRNRSIDSRAYGPVPLADVTGRVDQMG